MLQKVLELMSQISVVVRIVMNPWTGRSGFDYYQGQYTFPYFKSSDENWTQPTSYYRWFLRWGKAD